MKNNLIGISGHAQVGKDLVGTIIQWLTYRQLFTHTKPKGIKSLEAFVEAYSDQGFGNVSTWSVKKYADKMKDIVCILIGCTREQLEDRDYKETELGEEWRKWVVGGVDFSTEADAMEYIKSNYRYGYTPEIKSYIITPRLLLQLIGTECGRKILHPNTWLNATFADWQPIGYRSEPIDLPINVGSVDIVDYPNWIITDVRFPNEVTSIKQRGGIVIRLERDSATGVGVHESETSLDTYTEFDYTIQNNGTVDELVEQVRAILTKEKLLK